MSNDSVRVESYEHWQALGEPKFFDCRQNLFFWIHGMSQSFQKGFLFSNVKAATYGTFF